MNTASLLRHPLATIALMFLLAVPAQAQYVVAINADVHNGTGQDAYDFHLQGIVQGAYAENYIYGDGITPFDWTWGGVTFTGNTFEGTWSGSTAIQDSQTIHIGMRFDTGPNYMYSLVGWWTDASGNKLNPLAGTAGGTAGTYYSDVPFLGFGVNDGTSTLTLANATTSAITYRNIKVALSSSAILLSDLNQSSTPMSGLTWYTADASGSTAAGASHSYVLPDLGMSALSTLNSSSYLIIQGEVFDSTIGPSGDYRWFGEEHQVPEFSTCAGLLGIAALLFALWRRR